MPTGIHRGPLTTTRAPGRGSLRFTMAEDVSPIEALDALRNSTIGAVRTLVTAIVETYNPATNTAVVKFARRSQTADGQIYDPSPTPPLPVRWMKGGGWELRWELQPGDLVDLEVHDRSIGEVLLTGGPVDPENQRRFSFGDAVVIPGLASNKSPHAAGTGELRLGREDGSAVIRIGKTGTVTIDAATKIELGAGAAEALVKGDAFKTLYNAHTHGGIEPGAGFTAVPVVFMDVVPNTHTSAKVKTR